MDMFIPPEPNNGDGNFYGTNNPYLVEGPKGFFERFFDRTEDRTNVYIRLDYPGVKEEWVVPNDSCKVLFVSGEGKKYHPHDNSSRGYVSTIGVFCSCCRYTDVQRNMKDGVLRLRLTKTKIYGRMPTSCCPPEMHNGYSYPVAAPGQLLAPLSDVLPQDVLPQGPCPDTDPLDASLTGPDLVQSPWVIQGPKMSYEAKAVGEGGLGLYLRIDMPGVPDEGFYFTRMDDGHVFVRGVAPPYFGDSDKRVYEGIVAQLPQGYDIGRMKVYGHLGVLRIVIPPPLPLPLPLA